MFPRQGKFAYSRNGLTYDSHPRAPASEIVLATSGHKRISKAKRRKYRRSWWEAQVRLYGIKCTTMTMDGMRDALKTAVRAGLEVSGKIREMEEKMGKEYIIWEQEFKEREEEEEERENKEFLAAQKAWRERTTKEGAEGESGRARPYGWDLLKVRDSPSSSPPPKQTVMEKINEMHARLLRSGPGNDVGGTWRIDCPEISSWNDHSNHGTSNTDITWSIHPPQPTSTHLYAKISQVIVVGFCRIDWDHKKWKGKELPFTWRGRETGEDESQWRDEVNRGFITFSSSHECEGEFQCEYGGPYEFVGRKVAIDVAAGTESFGECRKEFEKFTERRWNRECNSRFGGWAGDSDDDEEGGQDFYLKPY